MKRKLKFLLIYIKLDLFLIASFFIMLKQVALTSLFPNFISLIMQHCCFVFDIPQISILVS